MGKFKYKLKELEVGDVDYNKYYLGYPRGS